MMHVIIKLVISMDKIKKISIKKFLKYISLIILIIVSLFFLYRFFNINNSYDLDKIKKSVLMLNIYDEDNNIISTGSGFVAMDYGILITNAHVIDEAVGNSNYKVEAVTEENRIYKVTGVLGYSKGNDYAILKINSGKKIEPLKISVEYQKVGSDIFTVGSPLGLKNTVSDGIISNYYDNKNKRYQFTAPISPGSSGGALLNSKGQVIGITYATIESGQNINLAIPIKYVRNKYEQIKKNDVVSLVYADDLYNSVLSDGIGLSLLNVLYDNSIVPSSIYSINEHGELYDEVKSLNELYIQGFKMNNITQMYDMSSGYYIKIIEVKRVTNEILNDFEHLIDSELKYYNQLTENGIIRKKTDYSILSGHTSKYLYYVEYKNLEDEIDVIIKMLKSLP